jgi:uncharacterized protein YjbI with pentapeptide repeats
MANLLVQHHLGDNKSDDKVTALARAQTLTTLRKIDPQGKRTIVLFLADSRLSQLDDRKTPIIYLGGADLSGTQLEGPDLRDADLRGASLRGVNLSNAKLGGATMPDGQKYKD